jgi:hypothetical protein
MKVLGRGRVAQWSKERIGALTTPELRQLMANAQRLEETEVAALCHELLAERPRGIVTPRKTKPKSARRRPVTTATTPE